MNIGKRVFILPGFLIALFAGQSVLAQDAQEVISKVQEQVAIDQSIRVEFQQVFEWKVTGKVERLDGMMVLEGLKRFHIATPDQTVVSNGETMWTYSRLENQVIIDKVRQDAQTLMPRDILFTYPEQYNTQIWRKYVTFGGDSAVALRMTPKEQDQFMQELKVWVSRESWQPLKVEFTDLNENTTTYEITAVQVDSTITEEMFTFQPDSTTEIIDVRQ
ncbi:MAG: Outer-membrane lipoprotein carrier protein [Candidatus Marinimicrobia bacterium]|nr:Outer-membrane lipoprotein carrier protein [Candidatus Neomarinimicrobiota bacterium]